MTILSFDLQVSVALTFNLPEKKKVSIGTFTPQREQLCQIILKFMHKCRSYGPDKWRWMDRLMHTQHTKHARTYTKLKL